MPTLLFRLGATCAAHPVRTLTAWAVALALAVAAAATAGTRFVDEVTVPGSESQHVVDLLGERFPDQGASAVLVAHARDGAIADPANAAALVGVLAAAGRVEHVTSIAAPERSADGRAVMVAIAFDDTARRLAPSAAVLAALADPQ